MGTGADVTIWLAFTAGVLSFFSPCVIPLIPSYLTYITGLSFGELQQAHPGARVRMIVLLHSLIFVAGFSLVFIALGAIAGVASASFQDHLHEGLIWLQRGGGVLVFLFGVHMTGLFHFGVLLGDKRVHLQRKPSGYLGTLLVGVAFAAGWTPCIGPVLGTILMIAASSGQVAKGVLLLSAYSAGLGLPFLVAGLLFHGFLVFFNRFRRYIRLLEIVTGVLLMVAGVMLFFGYFGVLSGYLYRLLPVME